MSLAGGARAVSDAIVVGQAEKPLVVLVSRELLDVSVATSPFCYPERSRPKRAWPYSELDQYDSDKEARDAAGPN